MDPDLSTKPKTPPAGADPSSGAWMWNGSAWMWNSYTGGTVSAFSPGGGSGNTGIVPNTTTTNNFGGKGQDWYNQNTANHLLQQRAQYEEQKNGNPFGNQYQSNLQYTPFGLTPYQSQGGQYGLPSAFGGLSFNSDLLVPQMEQMRMQRILQSYSPYGGGK